MGQVVPGPSLQNEDWHLPQSIGSELIFEPIKVRSHRQPHQFGADAVGQTQRPRALKLGCQTPLQVTDRHQPQGQASLLHQQAMAMAVDQPAQGV